MGYNPQFAKLGEILVNEKMITEKSAIYEILITNQLNDVVAKFSGTVHRTNNVWE